MLKCLNKNKDTYYMMIYLLKVKKNDIYIEVAMQYNDGYIHQIFIHL